MPATETLAAVVRAETNQFRNELNSAARVVESQSQRMKRAFGVASTAVSGLFRAGNLLRRGLADLGVTMGVAAVKQAFALTDAIGKMKRAFVGVKTAVRDLFRTGNLLRGGLAALGVTMGVAAVTQAFALTDAIGKTADKLGVGVESLQEWRFAAQQTGVAQQALDVGLQRFIRRLGEVSQGTGVLRGALDTLGFTEQELRVDSAEETFRKYLARLGQVESQTLKLSLAQKAFDTEGVALVNLANAGSDALERLRKQARDLGFVLSEETVRGAEAANDELTIMFQVIRTQLTSAIVSFAPEITALGQSFQMIVTALLSTNDELGNLTASESEVVVTLQAIGSATTVALQQFTGLFEAIEKWRTVARTIRDIEKDIEFVEDAIENTKNSIVRFVPTVLTRLTDRLNDLFAELAIEMDKVSMEASDLEDTDPFDGWSGKVEETRESIKGLVQDIANAAQARSRIEEIQRDLAFDAEEKANEERISEAERVEVTIRDIRFRTQEEISRKVKEEEELVTRETELELAARERAFQEFGQAVEGQLRSVFESAFEGGFGQLDHLKEAFFAFIADLAAKAATEEILFQIGAESAPPGAGAGGLSGLLGNVQLFRLPGRGAPAGQAAPDAGVGLDFGAGAGAGAPTGRPITLGGGLGAAAGAATIGAGVAGAGITGEHVGDAALGGVVAGAIIGSYILPGVGTIVGAAIGGAVGTLIGALTKPGPPEHEEARRELEILFDVTDGTVESLRRFGDAVEFAAENTEGFAEHNRLLVAGINILTIGITALEETVISLEANQTRMMIRIAEARINLEESLQTPTEILRRRQSTLLGRASEFEAGTPEQRIALGPVIRDLAQEIFVLAGQVFEETIRELDVTFNALGNTIQSLTREIEILEAQQADTTKSIVGQADALLESTQSAEAILLTRQNELSALIDDFNSASASERIVLSEEIQRAINEVVVAGDNVFNVENQSIQQRARLLEIQNEARESLLFLGAQTSASFDELIASNQENIAIAQAEQEVIDATRQAAEQALHDIQMSQLDVLDRLSLELDSAYGTLIDQGLEQIVALAQNHQTIEAIENVIHEEFSDANAYLRNIGETLGQEFVQFGENAASQSVEFSVLLAQNDAQQAELMAAAHDRLASSERLEDSLVDIILGNQDQLDILDQANAINDLINENIVETGDETESTLADLIGAVEDMEGSVTSTLDIGFRAIIAGLMNQTQESSDQIINATGQIVEGVLENAESASTDLESASSLIAAEVLAGAARTAEQLGVATDAIATEVIAGATSTAEQLGVTTDAIAAEVLAGADNTAEQLGVTTDAITTEVLAGATSTAEQLGFTTERIATEVLAGADNTAEQLRATTDAITTEVLAGATSTAEQLGLTTERIATEVLAGATSTAEQLGASASAFTQGIENNTSETIQGLNNNAASINSQINKDITNLSNAISQSGTNLLTVATVGLSNIVQAIGIASSALISALFSTSIASIASGARNAIEIIESGSKNVSAILASGAQNTAAIIVSSAQNVATTFSQMANNTSAVTRSAASNMQSYLVSGAQNTAAIIRSSAQNVAIIFSQMANNTSAVIRSAASNMQSYLVRGAQNTAAIIVSSAQNVFATFSQMANNTSAVIRSAASNMQFYLVSGAQNTAAIITSSAQNVSATFSQMANNTSAVIRLAGETAAIQILAGAIAASAILAGLSISLENSNDNTFVALQGTIIGSSERIVASIQNMQNQMHADFRFLAAFQEQAFGRSFDVQNFNDLLRVLNEFERFGFQGGTPFVPRNGLFQLHRGERVIPAQENAYASSGSTIHESSGVSLHIDNINIDTGGHDMPPASSEDLAEHILDKIVQRVRLDEVFRKRG